MLAVVLVKRSSDRRMIGIVVRELLVLGRIGEAHDESGARTMSTRRTVGTTFWPRSDR